MKSVLIPLSLFLFSSLHAANIDSLLQAREACMEIRDCFHQNLKLASALSKAWKKDAFVLTHEKLNKNMASINEEKAWCEGLSEIGAGYKTINELKKADSIFYKAMDFCSTPVQFNDLLLKIAGVKMRMGEPGKCLTCLEKIIKNSETRNIAFDEAEVYLQRGLCYRDLRQVPEALRDFLKVIEIAEGNPSSANSYTVANYYIATTYSEIKSYDKALEFYQQSLSEYLKEEDAYNALFEYFSVLLMLNKLERYDETITTGHKAIALKNKYRESTAFGWVYNCMGEAFFEQNRLDSASYYFKLGIEFSRKTKEHKELADNLGSMGKLLLTNGNYKEAAPLIEEAVKLRSHEDPVLFNLQALINERQGDYRSAYQALRKNWDNWSKRQENEESNKIASLLLEERFKREKEQQEQEFQHEIQLQQSRNTIIVLAVLLLAGMGLFYQIRSSKERLEKEVEEKTASLNNLVKEIKKKNYSLENENLFKQKLISIITHNVNGPLRFITKLTTVLNQPDSLKNSDFVARKMTSINETSKEIHSTINNILLWVSSKGEHLIPVYRQVQIDVLLEDSIRIYKDALEEKNIILSKEEITDVIETDEDFLKIILQNLFHNAVKFTPPNGRISVFTDTSDTCVWIKLSNSGKSIENERKQQLLSSDSYTAHQGTAGEKGFGLGLNIVKELLERMNGKLEINNNLPDKTTIGVRLNKTK